MIFRGGACGAMLQLISDTRGCRENAWRAGVSAALRGGSSVTKPSSRTRKITYTAGGRRQRSVNERTAAAGQANLKRSALLPPRGAPFRAAPFGVAGGGSMASKAGIYIAYLCQLGGGSAA